MDPFEIVGPVCIPKDKRPYVSNQLQVFEHLWWIHFELKGTVCVGRSQVTLGTTFAVTSIDLSADKIGAILKLAIDLVG